ncbi:MAG: peptidylprolyl isomerase [Rhodobacteraceae bacterium]|nr:peptidylprolyl isomerase [Paracoccaceae bacterium]
MKPLFSDLSVNGSVITVKEIAAEAQNHRAPEGKPGLAWRAAAKSLVIRELLLQEAARRRIDASPQKLGNGRRETDAEAIIRQLTEAAIKPSPPSPDEVKAAYDAQPELFRSPTLSEASHILIAVPDPGKEQEAEARAVRLLKELRKDAACFGRLAREHSACSSASSGGALGQLSEGDLVPEFEEAMRLLAPGEIADSPVRTRYGFHIVRLDARAEGQVLPFESVRERINDALEKASWASAGRDFIQGIVARAEISGIDMGSIPDTSRRTAAPSRHL